MAPLLRPDTISPIRRTTQEHHALQQLLQAAKHAEHTVPSGDRRSAYRTTRSLLAAARMLGFTVPELATITGVGVESVRNRSNALHSVARARFNRLIQGDVPAPVADDEEDPVTLLSWYLSAVFVSDGDDAVS